jgi:hypothetical protein
LGIWPCIARLVDDVSWGLFFTVPHLIVILIQPCDLTTP